MNELPPIMQLNDIPVREGAVEVEGAASEAVSEGAVEVEGAASEATSVIDSTVVEGAAREGAAREGADREAGENSSSDCDDEAGAVRYKQCVVCQKECLKKIKRCKKCLSGCYCSRNCREADGKEHEELCGHIQTLEEIEARKRVLSAFSVRELNQVKAKLRSGLVKLVGERPMLKCAVGEADMNALWDTGAMVSMVSTDWLEENVSDAMIMTVEEFLEGDKLHLCAANNTNVDVEGVVVLDVSIGSSLKTPVPFLVTKDKLSTPIIGYNLIKHLVALDISELPSMLKDSMPCLSSVSKAEAVVSLIQTDVEVEDEVRVGKRTIIPASSRCRVKCRTKFETSGTRQNVIFTPFPADSEIELSDSVVQVQLGKRTVHVVVSNPTNYPLTLEKGCVLGAIESLSALIPVGPKVDSQSDVSGQAQVLSVEVDEKPSVDLSVVDLSHLEGEQKEIAEQLLREESDVFCLGPDEHGDCPDLQMELTLTDQVPVVVPHRHIPRPLYEEVKNFINDLISNKWVCESKSNYSSPIVCVRKKDHSLRLCIDYRALNKKIVPDRQSIPRIQEIFDGLDGNEWFTTLDMAKAYH